MNKISPVYPLYTPVTVPVGTSTTAEINLGNQTLIGIITPSTFDGTGLTLSAAAATGGTFYPVAASNGASTAYAITTTASIYTPIDPVVTRGLQFIKVGTGSSQTTSDTILVLVTRPFA